MTLDDATALSRIEKERDELRAIALTNGQARMRAEAHAWRLANELLGVAEDVDGECVCEDASGLCECGGDGQDSDGDALEMGCAACWAKRLREVAAGIPWPERAPEPRPSCVCPFPRVPEGTPTAVKDGDRVSDIKNSGRAVIEGGDIVIRVAIEALETIIGGVEELWNGEGEPMFKIADANVFAADIVRSLNDEDERGYTRIHGLFDAAIAHAVEYDAEGIEERVTPEGTPGEGKP